MTAAWTPRARLSPSRLDASSPACQAAYRLFRITQTSENSNKHHYLACSGWELYGQLYAADGHSPYVWQQPAAASSSSSLLSRSSPAFASSSFSSAASSSSSPASAFTLTYVSDFDTNGVIHHIATHASFSPWHNPHSAGLLTVAASSLADDSVGVDAIVGHDVVRCVTRNEEGSWFSIDLHGRLLLLTAYTLRHYSSWDTECLRNWRLEGSRDGEQWDVLREHENDDSLKGKGSTHTWQISCSLAYSRFRIVQTAENSNRHHYLACSGWEMYGVLHDKPDSNGTEPMDVSADAAAAAPMPVSPLAVAPHSVTSPSSSSSSAPVFSSPTSSVQSSPGAHEMQHSLAPSAAHFFPAVGAAAFASASASSVPSVHTAPAASSQSFFSGGHAVSSPGYSYQWDSFEKGGFLLVAGSVVRNSGSGDKWQMVRSVQSFSSGHHRIAVKVTSDPQTSNTWRFIVGVVPATLDCSGSKQWVGTGGSWGYIAGTGGKCHNAARSDEYGERWGDGDVVGIVLDFDARTIEFWRNDCSQAVAYRDLDGPVHIAASLTAADSQLALVPFLYGREEDSDRSVSAQRACAAADVPFPPAAAAAPAASAAAAPASASHLSAAHHVRSNTPTSSPHAPPSFNRAATLPAPLSLPQALSSCWDPAHKSAFLTLDASQTVVHNSGSSDKWQCVRSLSALTRAPFSSSAVRCFRIELLEAPATPNSWQMIVGVVPAAFTCQGNKQWVGAAGSWGYIAGTGGKCYGEPKSRAYGEQWGRQGDVIHCRVDLDAGSIEFSKNGVSQGVAFSEGVVPPVYAAVSLTATGAAVRLTIES